MTQLTASPKPALVVDCSVCFYPLYLAILYRSTLSVSPLTIYLKLHKKSLTMSRTHHIDNDEPLFQFDDSFDDSLSTDISLHFPQLSSLSSSYHPISSFE